MKINIKQYNCKYYLDHWVTNSITHFSEKWQKYKKKIHNFSRLCDIKFLCYNFSTFLLMLRIFRTLFKLLYCGYWTYFDILDYSKFLKKHLRQVFCKNGVFKKFSKLAEKKFLSESISALLKYSLWHRCFPVNFAITFFTSATILHQDMTILQPEN